MPAMPNVSCPHCNGPIAADPSLAGQQVACPHCSRIFLMPGQTLAQAIAPVPSQAANGTPIMIDPSPAASLSVSHRYGRKKTSWPLWLVIGAPIAGMMLLCCGGLAVLDIGDGSGWYDVSIADFIDNTHEYRGDELEFDMMLSFQHVGSSLRQHRGGAALFYLSDGSASADVVVQIPANLEVPNASAGDDLFVQFKCTQGRLDSGNVATRIRRQ